MLPRRPSYGVNIRPQHVWNNKGYFSQQRSGKASFFEMSRGKADGHAA